MICWIGPTRSRENNIERLTNIQRARKLWERSRPLEAVTSVRMLWFFSILFFLHNCTWAISYQFVTLKLSIFFFFLQHYTLDWNILWPHHYRLSVSPSVTQVGVFWCAKLKCSPRDLLQIQVVTSSQVRDRAHRPSFIKWTYTITVNIHLFLQKFGIYQFVSGCYIVVWPNIRS